MSNATYPSLRPKIKNASKIGIPEKSNVMYGTIVVAALGMTVIMAVANYWVITPLYIKVLGMKITIPLVKLVLLGVVPFNLIKGIVIGGLSTLLVPKLRKVLTVAR